MKHGAAIDVVVFGDIALTFIMQETQIARTRLSDLFTWLVAVTPLYGPRAGEYYRTESL